MSRFRWKYSPVHAAGNRISLKSRPHAQRARFANEASARRLSTAALLLGIDELRIQPKQRTSTTCWFNHTEIAAKRLRKLDHL